MDPATVPVYETEAEALEAELSGSNGAASTNGRADAPRVVVLFCHAEREDVFALLDAPRRPPGRCGRRPARPLAAPRGPAPGLPLGPRTRSAARRQRSSGTYPSGASSSPGSANAVAALRRGRRASSPRGRRRRRRRRTPPRGRPAPRGGAPPGPRTARRAPSRPSVVRPRPSSRAALTPVATFVAVSPGRAAAQVRVLADDDLVERAAGEGAVLALVVVAPVAGDADDADRPPVARRCRRRRRRPRAAGPRLRLDHHPVHEVGQLAHAVDVVAVVDDDARARDLEQVEPARAPGRTTS